MIVVFSGKDFNYTWLFAKSAAVYKHVIRFTYTIIADESNHIVQLCLSVI